MRWPGNWILASVSVLLTLAVGEGVARWTVGLPALAAVPLYAPHPHLVYTGNPEARYWHNREGFSDRRHPLEKPAGTIRVAALGGSTTYGKGNWPERLAKLSKHDGGPAFEVLNFGMAGYTSLESLINLAINVQDYHPDFVVIHHALNDVMPRLYPKMERDYGHFRKRFETVGPVDHFLASHSALYAWLSHRLRGGFSLARASMTVHDSNPDNPFQPDVLNPDTSIFRRNLETMIAVARAAGSRPVLTTMPHSLDPTKLPGDWAIDFDVKVRGMNEHNEIIREIAAEQGVPLVDLDREMTGVEEFFFDHVHCREAGRNLKAVRIAEVLRAELAREPVD